jgi:hypothetical protein
LCITVASQRSFVVDAFLFVFTTGEWRTPDKERITTIHDHFHPSSKLCPSNRDTRVFASTVGCLLILTGLYLVGDKLGHFKVSMMY